VTKLPFEKCVKKTVKGEKSFLMDWILLLEDLLLTIYSAKIDLLMGNWLYSFDFRLKKMFNLMGKYVGNQRKLRRSGLPQEWCIVKTNPFLYAFS